MSVPLTVDQAQNCQRQAFFPVKIKTKVKLLMAHNLQNWNSIFLTCHCDEIYRVEAVGLKVPIVLLKIMIFVCEIWDNFMKNLHFVNNCLKI